MTANRDVVVPFDIDRAVRRMRKLRDANPVNREVDRIGTNLGDTMMAVQIPQADRRIWAEALITVGASVLPLAGDDALAASIANVIAFAGLRILDAAEAASPVNGRDQ